MQALTISDEATARITGRTACAQLGICLCQKPEVLVFCKRLFQNMKGYFVKRNKVLSRERALLEGGYIVVRFSSSGLEGHPVHWFHVGYTNFRTWHFSGMRLNLVRDRAQLPDTRLLCLGQPGAVDDVPESNEMHKQVMTIFEFAASRLDLNAAWTVQYWSILSDARAVSPNLMPARFVEVEADGDEVTTLWHGWDQHRPGRRRVDGAAPPQKQARVAGGRAAAPLQQAHVGEPSGDPFADALQEALDNLELDASAEQLEEEDDKLEDELANLLAKILEEEEQADEVPAVPADLEPDEPPRPRGAGGVVEEGELEVLLRGVDDNYAAAVQPAAAEEEGRDGEAAAAGARPRAPAEPGAARRAKIHEPSFALPHGGGELRYNTGGFRRAHCPRHGLHCTRQRKTTAGKRAGAGRCVGALTAWLQQSARYATAAEHVAARTASHNDRLAARDYLATLPGSSTVFGYERDPLPSDHHAREPLSFQ